MPRVMLGPGIALLPSEPQFLPCPWSLVCTRTHSGAQILTCRLLRPEVQLQVKVFDHITQLVVIGVFPELQEEEESGAVLAQGTARHCPPALSHLPSAPR